MSQRVVARLKQQFGDRILASSDFRGDDEARVGPNDWAEVARFLRDDDACAMDHFIDLTAVDYPERESDEGGCRFEVVLSLRSAAHNHRVRIKAQLPHAQPIASVTAVWEGADWAEREVWDMFGIRSEGHPDLRRILMYEEFEGHPLRKDYPIEKAQPLVPYRETGGIEKVMPFGGDEGQPYSRVDWLQRGRGRDLQVSPAIGLQQGQRQALSESTAETDRGEPDAT